MRIICSWCNISLGEKEPLTNLTLCGGMCQRCLDIEMRVAQRTWDKARKAMPAPLKELRP